MLFSRYRSRIFLTALALGASLLAGAPEPSRGQIATPLNNAATTLSADHAAGSGTLVVQSGKGSLFGSPSTTAPVRVTVARRSTLVANQVVDTTTKTIYRVTARSGDTLSGLTAIEGTSDQAYSRGDPLGAYLTAGSITEITAHLVAKDVKSDFGAIGDGSTDDTAALQAAADAAKAAGGGVVFLPPGTYLIHRPITLASNVTLRGLGRGVSTITKPASVSSLMTANCNAGALTATVADGSLFAVGDAIHLYDGTNFEWLSTQGRVTSKSGNVLTFVNTSPTSNVGANAAYLTSRSGAVTTSFPLIRNELTSVNIAVQDLTLDGAKGAGDPSGGNVDFTLSPVHWEETYRSSVERCEIKNSPSDAVSDQANSGRPGTGDGTRKSTRNRVQHCFLHDGARHGVHLGTTMDGAWVIDNTMTDLPGFGTFYCAYACNTIASRNFISRVQSGFGGIDSRDTGNTISGNTVQDWTSWGIEAVAILDTFYPGHLVIAGNALFSTTSCSGGILNAQINATITGNSIHTSTASAIGLWIDQAHRATATGNVVEGESAANSIGIMVSGADDVRLWGNIVQNVVNGAKVASCNRLVASGQQFTGLTTRAWWFSAANTDCTIREERNTFATPVTEDVASIRLAYEGRGDNGSADPAVSGDWHTAPAPREGTLVKWGTGHLSRLDGGVWVDALNNFKSPIGVGVTSTPRARADVCGTVNLAHLSATDVDSGGYLDSDGPSAIYLTGGAQYSRFTSNYQFRAKETAASGVIAENDLIFWGNAGLTTGNEFGIRTLAVIDGATGLATFNFGATVAGTMTATTVNSKGRIGTITSDTDAATVTFNVGASDIHTVTLAANRTLAVIGDATGQEFRVVLVQDGTGGHTVTWWSGIKWAGGSAPTLTATAGKADAFRFLKLGAGSYYGFVDGQAL